MLRRYLSLTFPVLLSAVAALLYLHFRQNAADAAPPQLAQADPDDPFKPPVRNPKPPVVVPADPTKPVDPDRPLAPSPRVKRKPGQREIPQNDDEVRTPFLRSLLTQLDTFDDATDADKDNVRNMLYEADLELSESMGPNMRRSIERANRKRTFVVGGRAPRQALGPTIKRKDVLPGAKPVEPAPMPEKLMPE